MDSSYVSLATDCALNGARQPNAAQFERMMQLLELECSNMMPKVEQFIRVQLVTSLREAYRTSQFESEQPIADVVSSVDGAQLRRLIKQRGSRRELLATEPTPQGDPRPKSPSFGSARSGFSYMRSASRNSGLLVQKPDELNYQRLGQTSRPNASVLEVDYVPRFFVTCGHRVFDWFSGLQEPPRTGYCHDFIHSAGFQQFMAAAILFNAWESAYACEYELQAGVENAQSLFIRQAELFLYFLYLAELLAKLWVHGLYFFVNSEWRFNIFDLCLISQFSYEMYMMYCFNHDTDSLSFMRTFRFLRVARALRMIRAFRAFEELATLVESLGASLYSFAWMLLAIVLIVALFALVSLQGATTFILTEHSEEMVDQMKARFGSLYLCMLSTYEAGTGGQSWEVFYFLMEAAGPIYAGSFLVFIAFFSLSVVNIVTGMMVDSVMRISQGDRERHAERLKQEKAERCQNFKELIFSLDLDHSGTISWEEFVGEVQKQDSGLHSHLAALELDIKSCNTFFQAMTRLHNSDHIPVDAFVDGCMRMAGQASSMDVHLLSCQLSVVHEKHMASMELLRQILPLDRATRNVTSLSTVGTT